MQNSTSPRDLRLIRLYYFLWIGAGGCLSPFVSLFYKSRGLSGTEIGLLSTFGAITAMLAAPVWARWGDASRKPRRLIMLALLASATFALLRGIQSLFWSISIFIVLDALISSGSSSLSIVQALTITKGEKSGFGSVRLWGSLGWAVITPLAGLLIERMGLYVPFAGYAVMLVAAVCALAFVRGSTGPRAAASAPVHIPIRQLIGRLIRNRAVLGVALALTTIWIATNGKSQFETLYMSQLGASTGMIGLISTASALFEVPFMLLADRLIHRFGAGWILLLSILIQAGSFLPIVLFPSIPSFFLSRILGSIALSMNVPAYYNYLNENAPEGQGGTVVSLFDATLRNGMSLAAAPLAGLLFDLLGPYWLYVVGMAGCLVAFVVLGALARPRLASTL
jgi:PPP family 3-phenylpropionic acid transporter